MPGTPPAACSDNVTIIFCDSLAWPGFPELDSVSTGFSKIGVLRKVISGN